MDKIKGKLVDVKKETVEEFEPEKYGFEISCKEKFEKNFVRDNLNLLTNMLQSFKGPCGIICGTEAQEKVEETLNDSEFFCLVRTTHKISEMMEKEILPEKDKEGVFYHGIFRFGKMWIEGRKQLCRCKHCKSKMFYSEEFEELPIYEDLKKFIE